MIDAVRSGEPPASLAEQKRYNGDDVMERLHHDFLGKCYLCETKAEHWGELQVDHRHPDESRRFEWSNLFPACNRFLCNQRRTKKYPQGGLLNPGEGVESRILQRVEHPAARLHADSARLVFSAVDAGDTPAVNTAAELDRIHNGIGSSSAALGPARARALRVAIMLHVELVTTRFAELERTPPEDTATREVLQHDLRKLFGRRAPYAMLVRSCFAHLPAARELFD